MAAAILHFGQEIDEYFPFLRQRGYSIHCVQSAIDFNCVSQSKRSYDLVSSTDVENATSCLAAEEARRHLLAPAILFQMRSALHLPQIKQRTASSRTSDYDLVIATDELMQSWIPKLENLVSLGKRLRGASKRLVANSIQLKQEASVVIERTQIAIERARLQREKNHVSMPIPNMLADRILKCKCCGDNFVFPAGEQLLFHMHSLRHVPDKCSRCNSNHKAR
jgi:hypothetical protein